MKRDKRLPISLFVFVVLLLVGCSSGTGPAQSSITPSPRTLPTATVLSTQTAPSPSQTTLPQGTILYKANWSHGFDGWQASQGWRVDGGQLLVDSVANTSILAPYHPPTPNYAIEARMQVVRFLHPGATYYVFANDAPGQDGYIAGAIGLTPPVDGPFDVYAGFAQAAPNALDFSKGFNQSDFVPTYNMRTYRVEVQGNELSFYIDGARIDSTYSQKPALSTGPLGILSEGLVLRVSSFTVTAL